MIGETLGKYSLEREIGSGGMGAVYLGTHEAIGKRVAIKVLHPDKTSESLARRFFNEARAAAAVEHPGMVDVFDFGTDETGRSYLVMEFLEGESLAERLEAGRLSESLAVELSWQAASTIAAAHAAGIIHRDLKPHNLFLTPDEAVACGLRVKVLDFGIAKLGATDGDDESLSVTRTGEIFGTPIYMSPEQCRAAGDVGAETDIYALGVVLYQMVTGRPPFVAASMGELISEHLRTPPIAPRTRGADISAEVDTLILTMLAKRASRRPTAAELVTALDAIRGGRVATGPATGDRLAPALAETVDSEEAIAPSTSRGPGDRRGLTATAVSDDSEPRLAQEPAAAAETVRPGRPGRLRWLAAGGAVLAIAAAALLITRPWQRASEPAPELDIAAATEPQLATSCKGGNGAACTELGRRVLHRDRASDPEAPLLFDLAFARYLEGCDRDDGPGCTASAELLEAGNGVVADPKRALAGFEKGCQLGDASGCAQLGNARRVGAGTEPDARAAFASYVRACEMGSPIGCREAGRQAALGVGTVSDKEASKGFYARAVELATSGCDRDGAGDCTSAGVQWFQGFGVEQDQSRGFALLRKGCDLGDADGCANVSQAYILGMGAKRDARRGLEIAEKGCRDGSRVACEIIAIVVSNGYAGDIDRARAREVLETECRIGARYCRGLATELIVGNIMPRDRARALEVGSRACDAGDPMACDTAAEQMRLVHGDDASEAEIKRLISRGCDAGDPASCVRQGRKHLAEGDSAAAVASLEFACRLSSGALGCARLGELLIAGKGVPANVERGLSLMETACKEQGPGACRQLALLHYRGASVPKNPARAVEAFLKGCAQLDDRSCLLAAEMLDGGRGVTRDRARAKALWATSCPRIPAACHEGRSPLPPKKPVKGLK